MYSDMKTNILRWNALRYSPGQSLSRCPQYDKKY